MNKNSRDVTQTGTRVSLDQKPIRRFYYPEALGGIWQVKTLLSLPWLITTQRRG